MRTPEELTREQIDALLQQGRWIIQSYKQLNLTLSSVADQSSRHNLGGIKAYDFPLPPLAEQMRIVAEVERRLTSVEELEAICPPNLQRATLRQSILQKVFTGELVSASDQRK